MNKIIIFSSIFILISCGKETSNSTSANTEPAQSVKLWNLASDTDKLTEVKTEYLHYESTLTIPDYAEAKMESKVYCNVSQKEIKYKNTVHEQTDSIKGTLKTAQIVEELSLYETPLFKTHKVEPSLFSRDFGNIFEARTILLNKKSDVNTYYVQGKYSNVFNRNIFNRWNLIPEPGESFTYNSISKLLQNGIETDEIINEKIREFLISELPGKVELEFSNGIKHIIVYDDAFKEFSKNCLNKTLLKLDANAIKT